MKQSNSRWAVNLTALVLAAGLLMGLFTGCFGLMGPKNDDTGIFKVTNYGIIYGYKCTKEELPANLVIPDKIGNKVITGISRIAFYGCTGLTSIDLSGCTSLTEIGGGAFYGCTGLTEVKLPASLTTIGNGAFFGCTKLASIDLSACTSLTEIGEMAFKNCSKLTGTIVFPASLKTIKSYRESSYPYDFVGAFQYCKKLQGADFSACANFTKIENSTFKNCEGLTEVKLPASLTEIREEAFKDCVNLTSAVFADKNRWDAGSTTIDSTSLEDYATAAKYLREETDKGGYCDKWWKKN